MQAVVIEQKSIQKDDIKEEPMLAEINWLDLRKSIPETGARYCPIISFSGEKNNMWSANIRIIENNLIRLKSIADVTYLFPHAPTGNIYAGNTFELFEGNKKVADGIFL